jgi:hypothetical protein
VRRRRQGYYAETINLPALLAMSGNFRDSTTP